MSRDSQPHHCIALAARQHRVPGCCEGILRCVLACPASVGSLALPMGMMVGNSSAASVVTHPRARLAIQGILIQFVPSMSYARASTQRDKVRPSCWRVRIWSGCLWSRDCLEFFGLDPVILRKAIAVLQAQRKGELVQMNDQPNDAEDGVKFFAS